VLFLYRLVLFICSGSQESSTSDDVLDGHGPATVDTSATADSREPLGPARVFATDISPLPVAGPRSQKRKRVQTATVLTSTPHKTILRGVGDTEIDMGSGAPQRYIPGLWSATPSRRRQY